MARNGVGVYQLPAGQPVVTGTSISSSVFNVLTADLANALTASLATDGQTAMQANLPMGGNKVTGLAAATVAGDAIRFEQVGVLAAAAGVNTDISSLAGVTTINGVAALHLNDIINGDSRIAQAGTSFPAPAHFAYDLDGWLNRNISTSVFTVAQVAGSTAGRLARQVTITTADAAVAAGDIVTDTTLIEGFNIEKYVGQTFTVAFRARVPVAGIHCVSLRNLGADRSYVVEINFPTANVYQNCSFTVVGGLPTAGTWNYTNVVGLDISFAHMCGTTFQTTPNAWNTGSFLGTANQVNDAATVGNAWALEKVTLNLGTVAAVSEISVEQELIRCQRYFELMNIHLLYTASAGGAYSTCHYPFKATKRTVPTISALTASSNTNVGAAASTTPQVDSVTFYSASGSAGLAEWIGSATASARL